MPTAFDGDDSIYIWGGRYGPFEGPVSWRREILKCSINSETVVEIGRSYETNACAGVWAGNDTLLSFGGYSSTAMLMDEVSAFKSKTQPTGPEWALYEMFLTIQPLFGIKVKIPLY